MHCLKILKPMPHIATFNCCFRELLDLWYDRDLCDLQYITEIKTQNYIDSTLIPEARVWVGEIGNILLYDQPLLDKYCENFKFALFGNVVLHKENTSNWIFWPRFPRQYEQFQLSWMFNRFIGKKDIESVFVGNQTTGKRNLDWEKVIDFWYMGNHMQHLEGNMVFSYEEYLKKLARAKYGLLLPGVGPKCLRDVECMGFGCVPIVTDRACLDYYEPWEEGRHYVFCDKPEELRERLAGISVEEWEYMSQSCLSWFERNCSVEGSYRTTVKILEENGVI